MPVSSQSVGLQLPGRTLTVTTRMALAYAAGIGETSQICCDDARSDFLAHPAICTRLEWLLVSQSRSRVLGLSTTEALRAVHAGQATRFLQPIHADAQVSIAGQIVEVRSTRAGALVGTQITLADAATGALLTSTRSRAVYRGVPVLGEDRALTATETDEAGADQGLPESIRVELHPNFPHIYTECADIWNPIHTERRAAEAAQLPGIIVHGTALWALAGRELTRCYAPGRPDRLRSLAGRFSAMVLAGEPITVNHGLDKHAGRIRFSVLNASGAVAVSHGVADFDG
ncbi:MAG: MaoC/PaaZ C-terminal domain-containing protein [Hyphomonadaceae bacterium]